MVKRRTDGPFFFFFSLGVCSVISWFQFRQLEPRPSNRRVLVHLRAGIVLCEMNDEGVCGGSGGGAAVASLA